MTLNLKYVKPDDIAQPDFDFDTKTLYFQNLIPNYRQLKTAKTSA